MTEEVRQSTGSQSVNADKTNNLVGNLAHNSIQMNTAALFNNYEKRDVANDFSKVKEEQKAEFVEFI